jgi:hypothetical protein
MVAIESNDTYNKHTEKDAVILCMVLGQFPVPAIRETYCQRYS